MISITIIGDTDAYINGTINRPNLTMDLYFNIKKKFETKHEIKLHGRGTTVCFWRTTSITNILKELATYEI